MKKAVTSEPSFLILGHISMAVEPTLLGGSVVRAPESYLNFFSCRFHLLRWVGFLKANISNLVDLCIQKRR